MYSMIYSVAHWSAWDDRLSFSLQERDVDEYTNVKCHVYIILYAKGR